MNYKQEIEFPCGYKIKTNLTSYSVIGNIGIDDEYLPVCPIHEEKCKKP